MSYPLFHYSRGVCALQENIDTVVRERVLVIVKNPAIQSFLIVQYKSNNEICFISGGIEEDDSEEQTVRKEILEESGISELTTLQKLPDLNFDVCFYSPHRHKNYHNKTQVYYAETTQTEFLISGEESTIQNPHRRTIEQIQEKVTIGRDNTNYESLQYLIDAIVSGKL